MAVKFFEKAAKRFKDANITSVVLGAYDIYANSKMAEMEYTEDLPQLVFLPAFHKKPPFRYFQDIRTKNLMESVQKAADIPFELPPNFFLSEEETKRFKNGYPLEDL